MIKLLDEKNGHLIYHGHDLYDIAKKEGTPLKICFLDIIEERINTLKNAFSNAIKELNYPANFIYLNANKANYGLKEITTAFSCSDGLETSSYYDLVLTKKIMAGSNKYLVCNGYKLNDYLDEIIDAYNKGYKIIDVIDSVSEYEYLKKANINLNVGLRIHIQSAYAEEEENDRFGLNPKDLEYILDDLKNSKLNLKMVHFHQRGFDYIEDKFKLNFLKVFSAYAKIQKLYPTVDSFNMGGGTPLPLDGNFDYNKWAKDVLMLLTEASKKYDVKVPNLFSENGKYSQKDACVNIYKVVGYKETSKYPWKIVNGSLLIAMPEFYALGEEILVKPVNGLDKEFKPFSLGGITCDCDDVFFEKGKEYIMLPDVDELYIALVGTGSYQNSMNGKRGVHHCLLPEEKDVIYEDGKFITRHEVQSIDEIIKLM